MTWIFLCKHENQNIFNIEKSACKHDLNFLSSPVDRPSFSATIEVLCSVFNKVSDVYSLATTSFKYIW
jgi:hypothetical protein